MTTEAVDRGDDFTPNAADLAEELEKDEKVEVDLEEKVEPEVKAEDKTEKAPKKSKEDNRVPQSRVDEITRKNKEALAAKEAEIERLKSEVSRTQVNKDIQAVRTKIDELDDQYEAALADGKVTEAKEIRKELRKLQDVYHNSLSTINSENASRAAVDRMHYDTAVAAIEAQHPELNPDDDAYDEDVAGEIAEIMNGLVKMGKNKTDALRKAVKLIMGDTKAKAEPEKEDKSKEVAEGLRRKALEKGLDASKKQPANLDKHGTDSDKLGNKDQKVDVLKLDQAKFAKLDEETKARLRGDDL